MRGSERTTGRGGKKAVAEPGWRYFSAINNPTMVNLLGLMAK